MMHEAPTPRIRGVALIVSGQDEKILILREKQSRPEYGKEAGMYSPPMETCLDVETDASALTRLIDEELPGLDGRIRIEKRRLGVYWVVPGICVSLYVGQAQDSLLPTPSESSRKEVGDYAWVPTLRALDLWLRRGAWEMLSDYAANRCNVVRRYCRPSVRPSTLEAP